MADDTISEQEQELIIKLRDSFDPQRRLDGFVELCELYASRQGRDKSSVEDGQWAILERSIPDHVLQSVDNDLEEALYVQAAERTIAGRTRKKIKQKQQKKQPVPDVVSRLRRLKATPPWNLRAYQLFRDFGFSVFKPNIVRHLYSVTSNLLDSSGNTISWSVVVHAVHKTVKAYRTNARKIQDFSINDFLEAEEQLSTEGYKTTQKELATVGKTQRTPRANMTRKRNRTVLSGHSDNEAEDASPPRKLRAVVEERGGTELLPIDSDSANASPATSAQSENDDDPLEDVYSEQGIDMLATYDSDDEGEHQSPKEEDDGDRSFASIHKRRAAFTSREVGAASHTSINRDKETPVRPKTNTSISPKRLLAGEEMLSDSIEVGRRGPPHILQDETSMINLPGDEDMSSTDMSVHLTRPLKLNSRIGSEKEGPIIFRREDAITAKIFRPRAPASALSTPDFSNLQVESSFSANALRTKSPSLRRDPQQQLQPSTLTAPTAGSAQLHRCTSDTSTHRRQLPKPSTTCHVPTMTETSSKEQAQVTTNTACAQQAQVMSDAARTDEDQHETAKQDLTARPQSNPPATALPVVPPIQSVPATGISATPEISSPDDVSKLLRVPPQPLPSTTDALGMVATLQPGRWLSASTVAAAINAFNPDPVLHRVCESPYLELRSSDQNMRRGMRDRERDATNLYILFNIQEQHWVISMLDRKAAEVEVYDPWPTAPAAFANDSKKVKPIVLEYAAQVGRLSKASPLTWSLTPQPVLAQQNSHDCGTYVAVRAILRMHGAECPSTIIPEVWRRAFLLCLSPAKKNAELNVFSPDWIVDRLVEALGLTGLRDIELADLARAGSTISRELLAQCLNLKRCLKILRDETSTILNLYTTTMDVDEQNMSGQAIRAAIDWHQSFRDSCPKGISSAYQKQELDRTDSKIRRLREKLKRVSCQDVLREDAATYSHIATTWTLKADQIWKARERQLLAEMEELKRHKVVMYDIV